jgi:hypothetical protein
VGRRRRRVGRRFRRRAQRLTRRGGLSRPLKNLNEDVHVEIARARRPSRGVPPRCKTAAAAAGGRRGSLHVLGPAYGRRNTTRLGRRYTTRRGLETSLVEGGGRRRWAPPPRAALEGSSGCSGATSRPHPAAGVTQLAPCDQRSGSRWPRRGGAIAKTPLARPHRKGRTSDVEFCARVLARR